VTQSVMVRASDASVHRSLGSPDGLTSARDTVEGRRLLLIRIIWIGIAALVTAVVAATIPARYAGFLHAEGNGLPHPVYATYEVVLFAVAVAVFVAVAALLAWDSSGARMALLSSLALVTFPVYASPPGRIAGLAPLWHWTGAGLAFVGVVALTLSIYLVPDGRFAPAWTRWLIAPWVVIQGGHQFLSSTPSDYTTWPPLLSAVAVAIGLGPAIAVMLYRYRHDVTAVQRRQTAWLIWGVLLAVGIVLATELVVKLLPPELQHNLLAGALADTARIGAVLLVPLAIAFAIARYRLWAIDLFIHRTLVYGMLTAIVIGLYVVVVGALSTLLSGHASVLVSAVATGLVALLFQPLRERLQRSVNHLLYGERDDPYLLLSRLGQRLEETLAADAVLPALVETVARALKLPYVAIALPRDGGSRVVAAYGDAVPAPDVLPLVYRQELVGELLVAPRAGSDSLSPADRRLFAALTRQAAVAVHASELTTKAVRLSAELQYAHSRLVTLREEERRRLRRDLHDGLGPVLASVTLQAENARDLIQTDPVEADAVLADLTAQAQAAIADIRRVVYDLRPPALDDLGLIDAIRAHADRLSGQNFSIRLESRGNLGTLPAAVEVAAYRICQEALTNVVRHAGATCCVVRLQVDDPGGEAALVLEVIDDGCGLPDEQRPGMGLLSMHARAAELCGTCVVDTATRSGRGTRVLAILPLACPNSESDSTEDR
jgi:signal transduction histidine kinase